MCISPEICCLNNSGKPTYQEWRLFFFSSQNLVQLTHFFHIAHDEGSLELKISIKKAWGWAGSEWKSKTNSAFSPQEQKNKKKQKKKFLLKSVKPNPIPSQSPLHIHNFCLNFILSGKVLKQLLHQFLWRRDNSFNLFLIEGNHERPLKLYHGDSHFFKAKKGKAHLQYHGWST